MSLKIQIIYNDSCPSFEPALKRIKKILFDLDLEAEIKSYQISTEIEAKKYKFIGSPTIYINNIQFEEIDSDVYRFDNCRTFTKDDGGLSPLPSVNKLKKMLKKLKEK
ncbi:MAG: hypothetical protein CL769_00950 [Chloroflexi bacterium]|nr:hypothetical protein [Chloroflexota bacterium]